MPRRLDMHQSEQAMPFYQMALVLADRSDCSEAKFGALIFKDSTVLSSGHNYVYPHFKGTSCEKGCPRRAMPSLRGGVASDTCIAVHAEEDAVNNLLRLPGGVERAASTMMVVAHVKDRKPVVSQEIPKPRCTRCANKIAHETHIEGVLFPVLDGKTTRFVFFGREEFAQISLKNLAANTMNALATGAH